MTMAGKLCDNAFQTGPGTDNQSQSPEQYYNGVLDDHSDPFGVRYIIPIGAALYEGGEGEAQCGQT